MGTDFTGDDYDKLKKVYSIWICMGGPIYAENTITEYGLLFTQHLAFTAKCVRKCSVDKQKSICEANLGWIFACYWNGVNSNEYGIHKRIY